MVKSLPQALTITGKRVLYLLLVHVIPSQQHIDAHKRHRTSTRSLHFLYYHNVYDFSLFVLAAGVSSALCLAGTIITMIFRQKYPLEGRRPALLLGTGVCLVVPSLLYLSIGLCAILDIQYWCPLLSWSFCVEPVLGYPRSTLSNTCMHTYENRE